MVFVVRVVAGGPQRRWTDIIFRVHLLHDHALLAVDACQGASTACETDTPRAHTANTHTHTQVAFDMFDLDGNGHPPVDTHMHVSSCSHTQVAFDMFDLDGNGHLDQKEFATMIEVCVIHICTCTYIHTYTFVYIYGTAMGISIQGV